MSEPLRIDCFRAQRLHARTAFSIAIVSTIAIGYVLAHDPNGAFLLFVPLIFGALGVFFARRCRTLRVFPEARLVEIRETGERLDRGSVLAVVTRNEIRPLLFPGGAASRPEHTFELALWSAASHTARAAPLAKLARSGKPLGRAELAHALTALGEPDRRLMLATSPAPVLDAARALANALDVPWLHHGVYACELRADRAIEAPLTKRLSPLRHVESDLRRFTTIVANAERRTTADGVAFEWFVGRAGSVLLLLSIAAFTFVAGLFLLFSGSAGGGAFLGLCSLLLLGVGLRVATDHGRYRVLVTAGQIVVAQGSRVRASIELDSLLDVEAVLESAWPMLCLCTERGSVDLPVETDVSAFWLADEIARAVRRHDLD